MSDGIILGDALDNVVLAIGAAFPAAKSVVAEDESLTDLPVPAIVVQISELEPDPGSDAHDGRFPCNVRIEARVIIGHRTPKARREVAQFAGALAAFVHSNRFGVVWNAATILAVEPDEFAPMADKFDVWRVEWVHGAHVGPEVDLDDFVATKVLVSGAPSIGPENEPTYVELSADG